MRLSMEAVDYNRMMYDLKKVLAVIDDETYGKAGQWRYECCSAYLQDVIALLDGSVGDGLDAPMKWFDGEI